MATNCVTQVVAEVLSTNPANLRVTQVVAEVLTQSYQVRLVKAQGYAVLQSAGDRQAIQKAMAYAVLDSTPVVRLQKAVAYAILHDTTISLSSRRRPVVAFCS